VEGLRKIAIDAGGRNARHFAQPYGLDIGSYTFAGEYPKDDPIKGQPRGYLRRNFALFANVRPVQAWPQVDPLIPDFDITILRENTEGFYPDRNLAWGYVAGGRGRSCVGVTRCVRT
jgi:hypothetical protein